MPSPMIQFRAQAELAAPLTARSSGDEAKDLSLTARRDLTRYYALLEADLATVARRLTPHEVLAICDILTGTHIDDALLTVRHLDHEIADAEEDGIGQKWEVDLTGLAATVKALSPSVKLALVDAIERWRKAPTGDGKEFIDGLRAVGLAR